MIKINYFKYINYIYISDKTKNFEKQNIIVMNVKKNANKNDIKKAILNIFNIKIKKVNTIIIKSKKIKTKGIIGSTKSWKKAYIKLEKGKFIQQYINKLEYKNIS